jgi:hypothetical protein
MNNKCPECGKEILTGKQDGSEHEEGCQIGCAEQFEYEKSKTWRKGDCI